MTDVHTTQQLNRQWSEHIINCCLQRGVDTFFLAPGSRCTPLTLAIANTGRASVQQHFDERALCFAALGYGRATHRAAAVVCTSGTAVANFLPAVVEASLDGIPLLLLTADRPPELREAGANQTIDQTKIFGHYVRWFFDLPCPTGDVSTRFVQSTVVHAIERAVDGPVHLNLMFREPLSASETVAVKPGDIPPRLTANNETGYTFDLDGGNTIVTLGACRAGDAAAARDLAQRLSTPLLADVASGIRTLAYDLQLLRNDNPPADTVIHVGGRITSKRWLQFLERNPPRQFIHLSARDTRIDPMHHLVQRVIGSIPALCKGIRLKEPTEADFAAVWRNNSCETRRAVDQLLSATAGLSEPTVARSIAKLLPADHGLYLGNSMPVRDMDAFGVWPEDQYRPVAANRGASGIDGLVASTCGFAVGSGVVTTAFIGDLSLLHDLNSLAMVASSRTPIVIVVVNNDGGGIFHFLPVAEQTEHFESFFGTPHGIQLSRAAEVFGLDCCSPQSITEFELDYQNALCKSRSTLIEVRTDRTENLDLHRKIQAVVRGLSA